jgi:flagellar hook protein FlgE
MSLFQSLTVGVAGMQSQATKLGVVSDNIANVNTVGYKGGVATFKTLLNGFNGSTYTAGGVQSGYQQTNQKSGLRAATDSPTDLSITGRGFFPVSDSATGTTIYYTRAGSFTKNSNGDFINSNGYFLKGWRLDNDGNLPTALNSPTLTKSAAEAALVPINIDGLTVAAIPTTGVALRANLKASETIVANNNFNIVASLLSSQEALPTTTVDITATLKASETILTATGYDPLNNTANMASGTFVTPNFTVPITVYDGAGVARTVNAAFLKTGVHTWAVEIYTQNATDITPAVGFPPKLIASGNVTFNADGTLATIDPALSAPTAIQWNTPVSASTVTFDFGTVGTATGLQEGTTSSTTLLSFAGNLQSSQAATSILTYDPLDNANNMASQTVAPHFTLPLTIYDSTGTARDVKISYLKTGTATWAVEVYAQTATDITPATGFPPGLIASGTLAFDGSGILSSVSAGLSGADVVWNSPAATSSSTFSFGTIGAIDGIRESTASFASTYTIQPDPVVYSKSVTATGDYDPTVEALSMSGGLVIPHYTTTATMVDNSGVTRDVALNFIKTANNTWAVEVTAQPVTDLNTATGAIPGQIAYGTVTFNADGSLATISPSLSNTIEVDWTGTTEINSLQYNWGAIGSTSGIKELTGPGGVYSSTLTLAGSYSPLDTDKSMASGNTSSHLIRAVDVVDQNGVLKTLNFGFLKTGINTWAVEIWAKNAADVTTVDGQIAHGIVTFNGDGTLASITPALSDPVGVLWTTGTPSAITLDLGTAGAMEGTPEAAIAGAVTGLADGLTQSFGPYQVRGATQNGSVAGENAIISIDEEGHVIGSYENGSVRRLFKIPLAQFISPDKLEALTGNVFVQTRNSGDALYFQPGQSQQSGIASNSLESSNVDLSNELSNMIIAQRSYQSNSKLITTTDNMLETIFRM